MQKIFTSENVLDYEPCFFAVDDLGKNSFRNNKDRKEKGGIVRLFSNYEERMNDQS